jgi:hypothetical protein
MLKSECYQSLIAEEKGIVMANGPEPALELPKLQFDYAWKWFSYHADQRVKMFNFMLIALGIFSTAIVSAIGSHLAHRVTAILCFVASVVALVFWFLDTRNRDLVELGEELLTDLEKKVLFGEGKTFEDRSGKNVQLGILLRQSVEDKDRKYGTLRAVIGGRHRFWLRFVAILTCGLFFIAGVWIWNRPQ